MRSSQENVADGFLLVSPAVISKNIFEHRTLLEKQGRTKWFTLMDPPHMAGQKRDDQHEHTFSNYVRIHDVVRKTCLRRWTIGKSGERGSGISVLPARHDDDDDLTYKWDLNRSEQTLKLWHWRGYPHSLKLQNWSLTIILLSIVSKRPIWSWTIREDCNFLSGIVFAKVVEVIRREL